jgi:hypothetical protein
MTGHFAAASSAAASFEALFAAGAPLDADRRGDVVVGLAVEMVARDVELRRAHLQHRPVEAARGDLRHALRAADVALELGDLREDRQLLGLLEAAQAHAQAAGLRRDDDHRAVRPVGGGNGRDEVGDARPVLGDADAVAAGDARIAVGHVRRALLVHRGNEADAGRRKDVQRVHIGRTDDAEDIPDALRRQGFHQRLAGGHAPARRADLAACHAPSFVLLSGNHCTTPFLWQ